MRKLILLSPRGYKTPQKLELIMFQEIQLKFQMAYWLIVNRSDIQLTGYI